MYSFFFLCIINVFYRELSRDRERERGRDKKRDQEDEEDAYERRKLERKLRDKEAAYQEVEKSSKGFPFPTLITSGVKLIGTFVS